MINSGSQPWTRKRAGAIDILGNRDLLIASDSLAAGGIAGRPDTDLDGSDMWSENRCTSQVVVLGYTDKICSVYVDGTAGVGCALLSSQAELKDLARSGNLLYDSTGVCSLCECALGVVDPVECSTCLSACS